MIKDNRFKIKMNEKLVIEDIEHVRTWDNWETCGVMGA